MTSERSRKIIRKWQNSGSKTTQKKLARNNSVPPFSFFYYCYNILEHFFLPNWFVALFCSDMAILHIAWFPRPALRCIHSCTTYKTSYFKPLYISLISDVLVLLTGSWTFLSLHSFSGFKFFDLHFQCTFHSLFVRHGHPTQHSTAHIIISRGQFPNFLLLCGVVFILVDNDFGCRRIFTQKK